MEIELELCQEDIEIVRNKLQAGSTDSNSDPVRQAKIKRLVKTGICDVETLKSIPTLTGLRPHMILERATVLLPSTPEPPPRNPELEARIQKYKKEQEAKEYAKMVSGLNPADPFGFTRRQPDSFATEVRTVNRQLTAVLNTILTVGGAFVFGYKGLDMIMPSLELELPVKVMIGMTLATLVFFADLYFIVKTLD